MEGSSRETLCFYFLFFLKKHFIPAFLFEGNPTHYSFLYNKNVKWEQNLYVLHQNESEKLALSKTLRKIELDIQSCPARWGQPSDTA